jgi:hypothetical protein
MASDVEHSVRSETGGVFLLTVVHSDADTERAPGSASEPGREPTVD